MTPWSVFQDGSLMTITPASVQNAILSRQKGIVAGYNTPKSHVPTTFLPN